MASLDKCLALLVVLSMISMVTGYVEPEDRFPEGLNLYCQRKNCYEVLRVDHEATAAEIKKAYRKMSLTYHPDKSDLPNAHETFMRIANAYEVLGREEVRTAYDEFLANPQRHIWQHYSRYYQAVYAPKSDLRLVVLGMLSAASALQLASWKHRAKRIREAILAAPKTQTAIKGRLKELLSDCGALNPKKSEQLAKLRQLEAQSEYDVLSGILVDDLPLTAPGKGYRDVVLARVLLLPLDLAHATYFHARWLLLFSILRREYGPEEEEIATRSKIGYSAGKWESLSEEERLELVQRRLWITENLEAYEQERAAEVDKARQKMMGSNRYKIYKRAIKKQ